MARGEGGARDGAVGKDALLTDEERQLLPSEESLTITSSFPGDPECHRCTTEGGGETVPRRKGPPAASQSARGLQGPRGQICAGMTGMTSWCPHAPTPPLPLYEDR